LERRLGDDQAMMENSVTRKWPKSLLLVALTAFAATVQASAQTFGERPIRYGNTSTFWYDGRGDDRDFPTNGAFPGNFAADPSYAAIGAAGFWESNPRRSAMPYPSQTYFGPARDRIYCQGYPVRGSVSGNRVRC